MQILANTFNCQVGSMPFTYPDPPMGTHKSYVADCLPFVLCIERRLVACSLFFTQGGKLQMVNSIISSLPTFYMCTLKLHATVIEQVEKYMRHCLWRGADMNAKKHGHS